MKRRDFLASSPLFFAALALSAKTAGALPVGFPEEIKIASQLWFPSDEREDWAVLTLCTDKKTWNIRTGIEPPFKIGEWRVTQMPTVECKSPEDFV